MMRRRPTLKDVAAAAGVSFKTVSRVVNRDPMVLASTRARVEQHIAALGYVPDDRARSMRSGASSFVGLLSDRIATTPFSVDLVRGMQDALFEHGMTLMISNTEDNVSATQAALSTFTAQRVAGLICATMYHRAMTVCPALPDITVLVNCYAVDRTFAAIVPDDEGIGFTSGSHLLALGHMRIAYITLPAEIDATQLRIGGLRRAFVAHGRDPDDLIVCTGKIRVPGGEVSHTAAVTRGLLEGPEPPTAIIAGNDEEALQVYNAAHRMGVSIPDALSVIGCDNNLMIAAGLDPPLTTVALPYHAMGQLAVERVFHPPAHPTIERIACPLIERGSTRAFSG